MWGKRLIAASPYDEKDRIIQPSAAAIRSPRSSSSGKGHSESCRFLKPRGSLVRLSTSNSGCFKKIGCGWSSMAQSRVSSRSDETLHPCWPFYEVPTPLTKVSLAALSFEEKRPVTAGPCAVRGLMRAAGGGNKRKVIAHREAKLLAKVGSGGVQQVAIASFARSVE